MLAAGIDIKVVSDTLGHSDTRITRDIYQAVLDDLARAAAEAVIKIVARNRPDSKPSPATKPPRQIPGMSRPEPPQRHEEEAGGHSA